MKKIETEKQYNKLLAEVDSLMSKGEENLTEKEFKDLEQKAAMIQQYESIAYPFPKPKTIPEMVELKMFEKRMSQTDLANITGIGLPKLNQILKGKRKPDIPFIKAIYEKLDIDSDFILRAV